jgi:tetratricopeptide (TPR) repeat protein
MKINTILIFLVFVLSFSSCENDKQTKTLEENKQEIKEGGLSTFDSLNLQIQNNPTNALLYNDRANFFLVAGKYNQALSDVNKALQIDTLTPDIWVTLADVYFAKERFVDSREVLLKAVNMDPKNTAALLKLARLYLIYRDYKTASDYINMALAVDPMLEDAYFMRAVSFAENGDTVKSIYNYQKAVEINPDFYDAWIELGALAKAQNNSLAEQYYLNALELDTNNTHALYVVGYYYQQLGDFDKSEKYYLSLLDKEDNENALFNLGYINLVYLNDYPHAIIYFQKALIINPDYHEALFNLAYALELSGDVDDARLKYKELLKKVPNHEGAVQQLNHLDQ